MADCSEPRAAEKTGVGSEYKTPNASGLYGGFNLTSTSGIVCCVAASPQYLLYPTKSQIFQCCPLFL